MSQYPFPVEDADKDRWFPRRPETLQEWQERGANILALIATTGDYSSNWQIRRINAWFQSKPERKNKSTPC